MSIVTAGVSSLVVGTQQGGIGSILRQRAETTGGTVVQQAHGDLYETARLGNVFCATSTTGRAPGTALGTTPPILLYNPAGSGKRYSILKVAIANAATGTLGTGGIYHCGFTLNGPVGSQSNTPPVVGSGASLTSYCSDIGNGAVSAATVFSGGTLNANPVPLYPAFQTGESVGGTTTNPISVMVENVLGAICLEPGSGWCLEGITAAGSSPLILCGLMWEETLPLN